MSECARVILKSFLITVQYIFLYEMIKYNEPSSIISLSFSFNSEFSNFSMNLKILLNEFSKLYFHIESYHIDINISF